MVDLLKQYKELNNSFKRRLIFHLGYDGGFFSEYNNMILAMLYCLENKIKFILYSKDANFGYKNGWTDYFLPFCEEERDRFRSGDKNIETQLFDVSKYIEKTQLYSGIKDVFILTDNYLIIEDFQSQTENRNIYTLCRKEARGYFNDDFQKQNEEFKRPAHEKLFASVDILSRAYCAVGTFSSNPGMYLGMRMPNGKMLGVDMEKWQIW
jgi:hypothetical protein